MPYTISNARKKLKADKVNPVDFGISSWDQANYQILANALDDTVVKDTYFNKGISDAVREKRVLAYPGGSTDPVTKEKLTEEQTQQAVASYTKDNAIAEIRKLASDYVDTSWQSTNYTPKGMEVFKANFESKIKELADKTKNYVSGDEFNSIFSQSANDRNSFQLSAFERNNRERGGVLGFLDKATPIATNIAAGVITGGLSTGAQIAINASTAYLQGAKTEDIVRGAIGSLVANQIRPLGTNGMPDTTGISVVDDFNKTIQAIGNPELQSAIFNGARQGVYATITEQDIAKNVAAGAVAGAIATNVQNKYADPALSSAVGEFIQAKIAGKSDLEAVAAAVSGYATEEERANAKKVIAQEVSGLPLEQVQALGYKTQDEITGSFYPQEKTLPPTETVAQRDPQDIDGLSLIRTVRTGREAQEGIRELPPTETVAQREEEVSEPQRLITESAEDTPQEEPEAQRTTNNTVLLGLLGGTGTRDFARMARTQRTPNEREAASMQALSQALSVGDPGDALFGSGLGRRRNVWNEESLRLKDELGG
jgi:hypothetical protein